MSARTAVKAAVSVQVSAISEDQQPTSLVLPWIFAAAEVYYASRKLLGEQAECAFLAEAMRRGLIVSKPYGESAPYDFIVEKRELNHRGHGGHRGRLWKIQVKSAWRKNSKGRYMLLTCRNFSRTYAAGEVDFFAAWVGPLDVWYIVPAAAVLPRFHVGVYPQIPGARGLYEKYKEAWHLLGAVDRG